MTKIELINEIENVVMNNGGYLNLGWVLLTFRDGELVRLINGCPKKVKYQTIAEIKEYLDTYNKYYAKKTETVETEAETVETEVEKNTENTVEPKATKKDIIMGLHENGEVKCDLATAEELAQEGLIGIKSYENGVLYGEINRSEILKEMFNDVEYNVMERADELWAAGMDDIEIVTDLFDCGCIEDIKYNGDGNWYCRVDWYNILTAFCNRWDNKLDEAA